MTHSAANIPLVSPSTHRIGWIGTGVMGSSMCENLIRRFFRNRLQPHQVEGGEALGGGPLGRTPQAVAEQSDVIFSIVGYPADVREVILGSDGALAGCRPGAMLVDMTTSDPSLAVEIAAGAASGRNQPRCAGLRRRRWRPRGAALDHDRRRRRRRGGMRPCWQAMGKTIVHQGGPGAGQHTKMVNQTLVASNMVGVCESLLYGYKAGLDLEKVLSRWHRRGVESVADEPRPADVARQFCPRLLRRAFLKDMAIVLAESGG